MTFRAVLFDAAETLFTTRASVGEIYAEIARQYGSKANPDLIQAAFVRHFRGAGPISIDDQKNWWKEVVHRVFSDVGMIENFDEFFDCVYDIFRDAQGWVLFPETRGVLAQLKALGLKLGIVSNFDSRIYSVLDSLGIHDFFDTVTISSEAGHSKPASQIFTAAARSLGMPASAILVVGDSLGDDVEAAKRAGMSAIWLNRRRRLSAPAGIRTISSLVDVVGEVTP